METSNAEKLVEDVNYGLGFNDVDFSDRVLRLEIELSPKRRKTQELPKKSLTDLEVETLNICSLMLAAKLFKNGMKESQRNSEFTLRIEASEKAPFMDLLNSVYDKPLTASSRDELMDVLMVADKFEVICCVRHCVRMLLKLPMTIESALFYLGFPSTVFVGEVTRPLMDATKQHLSSHFRGFTESQQEEAMSLPLCGIEAIFGSADFQVNSEVTLMIFMLKWARKHYSDVEERIDILTNRLLGLVCFPCMSALALKRVTDCPDFISAEVTKRAVNALFYNIELPNSLNSTPTFSTLLRNGTQSSCVFPRCRYKHRRVVFFDVKKKDCAYMVSNSSRIYSEAFLLDGQRFYLFAQRYKKQESSIENLGLFVEKEGLGSCRLSLYVSAMKKPSYNFEGLSSSAFTITDTSKTFRVTDLFKMTWTELIGDDDNDYIIDGVMHIRVFCSTT